MYENSEMFEECPFSGVDVNSIAAQIGDVYAARRIKIKGIGEDDFARPWPRGNLPQLSPLGVENEHGGRRGLRGPGGCTRRQHIIGAVRVPANGAKAGAHVRKSRSEERRVGKED